MAIHGTMNTDGKAALGKFCAKDDMQ